MHFVLPFVVLGEGSNALGGANLPHLDARVVGAGGQQVAIRREDTTLDPLRVGHKLSWGHGGGRGEGEGEN